ncbi:MAG: DEAD/DEAH box helicase [Candidatus Kerfeldbacteria bacterium]|nr:DEAD/DEAH box helicase [Candidatus Kerfeldbacteria bacterium]
MTPAPTGFSGLGIAPSLLNILGQLNYTQPTPIQVSSIPVAIEGKDLIGIAQTGTGKTLAFGVPLIQRLAQVKGKALILLPTRELALQVEEAIQKIGRTLGLRTAVLIGGAAMGPQTSALRSKPHIVVATPGRLIDHLEHRTVQLHDVTILVLDEADRMLDMGFAPQIKRILQVVPKERQTLLFSATMPDDIVTIARQHMQLPVRVEIARAGTAASTITQELFFIGKEAKVLLLQTILEQYRGSVLVFSRTKHGARRLARQVKDMGHPAADIHSDRSLAQRREALAGFKSGKYRVLVATDIAARGIDVVGIELVVNYDLPGNPEDYVHRIGRTGRAGIPGRAISFATFEQRQDVRSIERLLRTNLKVSPLPVLPAHQPQPTFSAPPFASDRSGPPRHHRRPFRGPRRPHHRHRA